MAKQAGRLVFHHVDGNLMTMMPGLIDMGIDILNPIEPCAGLQDIYELKARYGDRITLCGNIDVDGVLMHGSTEEVTRDVHEHIDRLGGGGGYICASSHDLHQLVPLENYYAMRDAVHEHRFVGQPAGLQSPAPRSPIIQCVTGVNREN
jgi:uroporphyrinogen decarboxylase